MTVRENVEYGLKVKGVGKAERRARAGEMLESGPPRRLRRAASPTSCRGGQRQRVALARALVNRPKVLLLDEPLGALDLKLREEMQVELKAIQREVGITFVFVTHDQDEALSMSDRIAVFNNGRIEQVGTPAEIYERPATPFVAGFVGTSNVLDGAARAAASAATARSPSAREDPRRRADGVARPTAECVADGTVRDVQYLGARTRSASTLDGGGAAGRSSSRTRATSTAADDRSAVRRGGTAARVDAATGPRRDAAAPTSRIQPTDQGGGDHEARTEQAARRDVTSRRWPVAAPRLRRATTSRRQRRPGGS